MTSWHILVEYFTVLGGLRHILRSQWAKATFLKAIFRLDPILRTGHALVGSLISLETVPVCLYKRLDVPLRLNRHYTDSLCFLKAICLLLLSR